ncbi:general stress protein [Planococcus lenghuensis]|uniref:General stress protein 17M-like domain-containing protein n=1 Tax=Planococcus lenghuensis TaxID=2213202 RepID=A0A1Q2KVB4_9BACL|nr:general stress protein [Planococcus lenghuensis]AQQ52066.1 hypothetical protein B0X71_02300 [Planococcus lenghuensis]
MTTLYREYHSDTEAVQGIEEMQAHGIDAKDIYVFTQTDQHSKRIAKMGDANTPGPGSGIGSAITRIFGNTDSQLTNQFRKFGFTETEATYLKEKLDEEKIIIVAVNTPDGFTL